MTGSSAHPELRAALIAELEERAPRVDRDRVGTAFDFADQAHGDQMRESGQPFISHALEVCRILLGLLEGRLDTTLACAALLHDVVEDTAIKPVDLEKRFGKEVAGLVEGVTKLSGLHFDSREAARRAGRCAALVVPGRNEWNGTSRIQLKLKGLRLP